MSKPPLRVVTPDAAPAMDMAAAIEALMRKVIAAQPVAVMVAWEDKDGAHLASLPASAALIRGMVDWAFDQIHPEPFVE